MRRPFIGFLFLIVLLSILSRFIGLGELPPGFYVDEAAGAANVICLREHGVDGNGETWSFFAKALGGGYSTWPFTVSASLWTSLFGDSPAAFRSLSAAFNLLTCLIVGLLALQWFGRLGAVVATTSVLIMPWSLQFARISWDPPLAPFFLVLGLVPLIALQKGRSGPIMSGLFFALAAYSYPPTRIHLALLFFLLWMFQKSLRLKRQQILISALSLGVFAAPLIWLTLNGDIQGRFNVIGIFSNHPWNPTSGLPITARLVQFLENLLLQINPEFLFINGDQNLRHGSQHLGTLSYLDATVLFMFPFLIYKPLRNRFLQTRILFCIFAAIAASVPAALTWEGLPHSLRAIGAFPFFALVTGGLAQALFTRASANFIYATLTVATFVSVSTTIAAYTDYSERAKNWFDVEKIHEIENSHDLSKIEYPSLAMKYHRWRRGEDPCTKVSASRK